jgi:hypothetical protein
MVCPLAALTAARASTYAPAARLARWCCAGPPPVRTTLAWRRRTVPRPRCVLQRPHVIVSVRGAPRRVHAGTSTPITAVDSLIPSSPLTGSYSVRPGGYALASACTTLPSSCSSYTRHAWTRSNSSTVPSRTLLLRTSRRACTTRQSLTSCRNAAPLSRTHLHGRWVVEAPLQPPARRLHTVPSTGVMPISTRVPLRPLRDHRSAPAASARHTYAGIASYIP